MIMSIQATPVFFIRVPAMFFSGSCIDTKLVHSSDAVGHYACRCTVFWVLRSRKSLWYFNLACPLDRDTVCRCVYLENILVGLHMNRLYIFACWFCSQ